MINDVVLKSVGIIISKYLWTLASRHYLAFGPGGMLPKQEKQFRKRFNEEAIYELISFLTSKHNMEFWAHGDRLLQYSNGDIVTIPSVYNLLFSCSFTSQIRKLTEISKHFRCHRLELKYAFHDIEWNFLSNYKILNRFNLSHNLRNTLGKKRPLWNRMFILKF